MNTSKRPPRTYSREEVKRIMTWYARLRLFEVAKKAENIIRRASAMLNSGLEAIGLEVSNLDRN